MADKILYLPIETLARELDGKLLLAHRALDRGYSVFVGKKGAVKRAAEITGYGAFLYKSHVSPNIPENKCNNLILLALDEEGLVFPSEQHFIERAQPNALGHLDLVFVWGEYQSNLLIKLNSKLKNKIKIVGNPRFDLLREELRQYYKKIGTDFSYKWGEYVLINTNFTVANFSRYYGCSKVEYKSKLKLKNKGEFLKEEERLFLEQKKIYQNKLFLNYKNMIFTLAHNYPKLNFIVRPHPSEDHENWKNALKNIDNAYVIYEGSAVEWIQGAKALIHTGCTTGIEAWASKKPVIVYNPEPDYNFQALFPDKLGIYISNEKDLSDVVEDIIKSNSKVIANSEYQKQIENARQRIANISGKLAADRILDSLDELYQTSFENEMKGKNITEVDLQKLKTKGNVLNIGLKKVAKKIVNISRKVIKNKKGKEITGQTASKQKFPELRESDITKRLEAFDEIFYNGKHHYIIKEIAKDTFLITVKN